MTMVRKHFLTVLDLPKSFSVEHVGNGLFRSLVTQKGFGAISAQAINGR